MSEKIKLESIQDSEDVRAKKIEKLTLSAAEDIDKYLTEFETVIIDLVSRGEITDARAKDIEAELRSMTGDATKSLTRAIALQFPNITTAEGYYFDSLGLDAKISAAERKFVFEQFVKGYSSRFGSLTEDSRLALRRIVRRSIGETLDEDRMATDLRAEGDKLASYAKTISRSGIAQVSQAYNTLSADKAGLTHAWYAGTLTPATRPFCRAHYDQIFTRSQILSMTNGSFDPVIENRGGYNCRHRWVWVNTDWDPRLKNKIAK